MKYFLVLAALLFATPAVANQCGEGSAPKTEFLDQMSAKYEIYTLTDEARIKLINYVNPIRTTNGAEPFTSDAQFYFAQVEVNATGVVWFSEGCVVAGSVILLPSAELAKAMQLAGVGAEDFIEYKKGSDI